MAKKYYWLKLKTDFFTSKPMKKLRKIAGGDTYTIIYLKLQLLSLQDEGKLYFDNIEDSFAEELALEIDEDPDNVKFTLLFLEKCGLAEFASQDELMLHEVPLSIGKETDKAQLMRNKRAREKIGNNVTEALPDRYTEKEIEKEIEIDTDIEKKKEKKQKPTKHKYGEYNNVLLTDEELEKLQNEYTDWQDRIERLSSYVASTGKSYKSHYATIRNWARKDTTTVPHKPMFQKTTKAEELNDFYRMAGEWGQS